MDLSGKVPLIKRGEISFADKVKNAAAAGAEAVIIFNNASGVIPWKEHREPMTMHLVRQLRLNWQELWQICQQIQKFAS